MIDLFSPFTHNLGIDLGTSSTRILVQGKGIAVREPSVVAIQKKTKEMVAVGSRAKQMIGKNPANLQIIKPIVDGVIADFEATVLMLSYYIKQLHQSGRFPPMIPKPKVLVSSPSGVTEVERKAVADVCLESGARKVFLVEQPMAAAIGANLDVLSSSGSLIVVLGEGVTDMAVISLGGIVQGKCLKIAGEEMTKSVINFMRLKYSLLTGELSAEQLKKNLGSATIVGKDEEKTEIIRGRNLETGFPVSIKVGVSEIREALAPVVNQIITAISDLIEETPPELLGDITKTGICLAGDGANLLGLDRLINQATKIPVWVAEKPEDCTVKGCGRLLQDEKLLKKIKVK